MNNVPPPVAAAIQSGATLAEILTATLQAFQCQAGTIHLLQDGELHLAAHHGIPPQVSDVVQRVPVGKGIAGLAAQRLEPVSICNLQTDTSGRARPGARATGMEGSLAVPMLTSAGELRGVLGIAHAEAYDWSPEETALVSEVGRLIAERP